MTDRDALYRAIIANPDEDTPRLIYADWLDENGQPERAAFIRAQVEAVRADPFGLQARNAVRRADEILKVHRAAWTRHLHGGFTEVPRFERGFVAHLSVEPTEFVPAAIALFDAEPVQSLRLSRFLTTSGRPSLQPFFELPQLRQVRRLEISPRLLADEEYEELSGCSRLAGLRDISLRDNPVPPGWLSDVLTGNVFPELTGLDVAEIPNLGPRLTAALGRADHRALRRLNVSGVVFTSDQLKDTLVSPCLRQVE